MNDAAPVPSSAIINLRRRLVALAADPRVKLWPEATATLREVIATLDELADQHAELVAGCDLSAVHLRLDALERRMATVIRLESSDCDS